MVAITLNNFRVFNAEQFKESVSETAASSLYLTIGKIDSWANDAAPTTANASISTFYEVWNNMIAAKKITGNDLHHCIPRYNWTANTKYTAYDHEYAVQDLISSNAQFYVVTSDWNVYKCLSNNASANSTVEPSSIATTGTFQTADLYTWKYMYSIPASERIKFTTSGYIPVKTLAVDDNSLQWDIQTNAVSGTIDYITIVSSGSGYSNANTISVTITGDGSDCNAYAQINTVSNTISSIVIDDIGRNYTTANVVVSDSTGGTGAVLKAIISPPGGHGSDPMRELGGSNLILNMRLRGTESDKIPTVNEFRQIAVVKDPYKYDSNTVSSNTVVSQFYTLTLTGSSVDFIEDEVVYQGSSVASATFKGRVFEWDNSNNIMRLTNVTGTPTDTLIIGSDSGASRQFVSVTNAELEPYSGTLMFVENIQPIERGTDQIEDIKMILRF